MSAMLLDYDVFKEAIKLSKRFYEKKVSTLHRLGAKGELIFRRCLPRKTPMVFLPVHWSEAGYGRYLARKFANTSQKF